MVRITERPCVNRRFVLLGGESFYATGGFNDFLSSHDTLDIAVEEGKRLTVQPIGDSIDWWHVWDCLTNSIVAKSEEQAYGANKTGPKLDGFRNESLINGKPD